jgi:uncharacterized protein (DUF4415 family)
MSENDEMRDEYDFTNARPNPYAAMLKRMVTIRLDKWTIDYFQKLSEETGIPYQTLINLYLRDCAAKQRKPSLEWLEHGRGKPSKRGKRKSLVRSKKAKARKAIPRDR